VPAHDLSAAMIAARSLGKRLANTVRSCSSSTVTTLLLECKSIPAYSSMSASFVGTIG
jgi:hypothetical protein